MQNACNQGTTIDTLTLNFGYYLTAQPLGLAVLNGVLRNATQVDSTSVTGGATDTLYVELYGTGIRGAASVQCFVAGQSVPVLYTGQSASAGLDQVNISIPKSLACAGDVRLYVVADGVASNVAGLNIQ